MENDNPLIDRADELIVSLDNGPPDEIILAGLKSWISDTKSSLADLTLLRGDLIARISGMAKAIAVARHSIDQLREAQDLVDDLARRDANELIAAYRKTAARFRDTFRSTFDPIRGRGVTSKLRPSEIRDLK